MEAFVLSRVDGRASGADIALATGVPLADVVTILGKLHGLGAVQYGDGAPAPQSGPSNAAPSAPAQRPQSGTRFSADPSARPAKLAYDPQELDETADLDPDRKHHILQTFYRLEKVTHYELLGVPMDAEKKAIKSAYFDVVGRYHPDKYFGKSLGSFKPKLEKIFQRVTEAHDTLTRAANRAEYDSYVQSLLATRAFEEVESASIADVHREIEREARLADPGERSRPVISEAPLAPTGAAPSEPALSSAPDTSSNGPVPPSGAPAAHSQWSNPPPRPALTADDRRRALARKLGASMPPAARQVTDRPVSVGPNQKELAADALRRRYEARLEQAREERVRRYMKQSEESLATSNFVAAANALRIAVSLAPNDVVLADQLEKVERQASATLADQYLEQARYDERRGHMAEAAHAYEKVLRGRPGAYVYERAAHCILEASLDLKKAGDYAKKAVELSPNETAYRITLARVYAKAGMEASAVGELERARTLDPSDDTVKDWIRRVKRGEI
jgi:curved DNA-binding protein CbpA